jgi:hypothetical protein
MCGGFNGGCILIFNLKYGHACRLFFFPINLMILSQLSTFSLGFDSRIIVDGKLGINLILS